MEHRMGDEGVEGVGRGQSAVVVEWLYSVVVVEVVYVAVAVIIITLSPVLVEVADIVFVGRRTSEQRDV